jgi:hypothetical protein
MSAAGNLRLFNYTTATGPDPSRWVLGFCPRGQEVS